MIERLKENEIFVFGSNTAGRHGRGAALQAKDCFGAVYGVGEGITGRCYAYPTLDGSNGMLTKRSDEDLVNSRNKLYETCLQNPNLKFLLTRVGCGLAGYDEDYMRELFLEPPTNMILPEEWNERKS